MEPRSLPTVLDALKREADFLFKAFRNHDPGAVRRFASLKTLGDNPEADATQRKHALTVIAVERGFPSWAALLSALEHEKAVASPIATDEIIYPQKWSSHLNKWFASRDDAVTELLAHGGYLFPYRHHYFICDVSFVRVLGTDPHDPDWARIGHDWTRPADLLAWLRLNAKIIAEWREREHIA